MDSRSSRIYGNLAPQGTSSQQSTFSSFQTLQKKLQVVSLRRSASESSTELIGSLGLTLLYEPEETLVDFVFVHGLRGGSRKTWSFSADPAHFWPKEWLPGDPDFKNVRIHTFGYHSDWGESKGSDFNVHDFGQNLIEELCNSPIMGRSRDVPIVLIGHSMGGLVIKKAVILSRENPPYRTIGDRFHSLYFLATPHRGSDLAQTLNNILRMVFRNPKAYVTNLERSSEAQQIMSDSFRHYYSGIHIHSFLESIPMNLGYGSALIVDRSSATLGYTEERVQVLNADHRSICKYETPLDPNFQTIRNRLAATVHGITRNDTERMQEIRREQMRNISSYLNISDSPVDDLTAFEEQKLEGSCEWLTKKETYQDWRYNNDSPKCFWLRGKPAMGKSMLSSHVIQHLEGTQCSYFFFKHQDRLKSSLAVFLRSMAYQMASSNRSVRQQLLKRQQDDPFIEMDNARSIWRKVFGVIFKAQYRQAHYWVIDGLDECKAAEAHDFGGLFGFLSKIDKDIPLKLFVTSRFSSELEQLIAPLHPIIEQVTAEDTTDDIRAYVEMHSDGLPGENEGEQNNLARWIIAKSAGCFLWAVVVVRRLEEVVFLEETKDVLEEVPQEMEGLYIRSLQILSNKPKYKFLAISILNWTVCSMRALTTLELKEALKLDINQTIFKNLEKAIPSLSGHMVTVDHHSRVQTIHQTATAFLTDPDLDSEFRVNKSKSNVSLAKACLKYLCGEEMQTQRRSRSRSISAVPHERSNAFCDYACSYFSEHLLRATSTDDELLKLITTFLQTNILTWIEVAAQKKRLDFLTRAAKHLKAYLDRRAKLVAPLGGPIRLIEVWATDLPRVAGEFGINLIKDPSAIHQLIPPLCPPNSAIYKQFAGEMASKNTFQVTGMSAKSWNDRVACIYYGDERAESIACRDGRFAVGFSNGNIVVYYGNSCQEVTRLKHGDGVLVMELGSLAALLAASSRKSVKLWNVATGSILFTHDISPGNEPLTLCIDDDGTRLMIATMKKEFIAWKIPNGSVVKHQRWAENSIKDIASTVGRPPTVIKICLEHKLLAVTYRSLPVFVWDLDTFTLLGRCDLPTSRQGSASIPITDFVFNPNLDVELLAVAYMASELVLYDTSRLTFKASVPSECDILVASSDGRTLAGGDSNGRIQLFDFDTLQLLTQISLPDYSVKAMRFSGDGLRLFDLRDCECNVWEPSALVRKSLEETNSAPSASAVAVPSKVEALPIEDIPTISALPNSVNGDFIVCGNDHGCVVLYDLQTGKRRGELYKHARNCSIRSIQWNESVGIVSTVDIASRLQVVEIVKDTTKSWKKSAVLLDERLGTQVIRQQLLNPNATKLLVATSKWTFLYDLVEKQRVAKLETHAQWWPWISHPSKPDLVLLFQHFSIRAFNWTDLEPAMPTVKIEGHEGYDIDYEHYATFQQGGKLLMRFASSQPLQPASMHRTCHISTLDLSLLDKSTTLYFTHYFVHPNSLDIDFIIGTTTGLFNHSPVLLFFTKSGWICSIDIDEPAPQELYIRHFFVPSYWLSGTQSVIVRVTKKKDVLFVLRDEIAVFRNALDHREYVNIR